MGALALALGGYLFNLESRLSEIEVQINVHHISQLECVKKIQEVQALGHERDLSSVTAHADLDKRIDLQNRDYRQIERLFLECFQIKNAK